MAENKRKLLSPEREQLILAELGDIARTISELSGILEVSEATVRRDLQSLEDQKKIRRVHGGAIRLKPMHEPLFTEKENIRPGEKSHIASLALELIEDNDVIYLDGGSTVLALAKLLASRRGLTVVTNSLMAAAELMESGHKLILVGGEFRPLSRTVVGPLTEAVIKRLHINKAFMGSIGFTLEDGMSTTDANEAFTKELIMRQSQQVILLLDSSKVGAPSFAGSGELADIDILLTDADLSPENVRVLQKSGVEVKN